MIRRIGVVAVALLVATVLFQSQWRPDSRTTDVKRTPTVGNVQTLVAGYERWKAGMTHSGRDHELILPLRYSRGLSAEFTKASGVATLDITSGHVRVEVSGLPTDADHEVWLIDNRSGLGKSVAPDAEDRMIRLGELARNEGEATFETTLNATALAGFELDHMVVAQAGRTPKEAPILFGSPNLFQRLYYHEERGLGTVSASDYQPVGPPAGSIPSTMSFSFLVPQLAHAQDAGTPDLEALIAQGENLFFNETFGGNGRTCGTCHPADNNFTIDPDFIATLPGDDPLFVAEFNDDLADLEDPTLMRQFGLIRANVDGFEDPTEKFVMRSVPHLLGMAVSIQSVSTEAPLDMTGWSGDGAPGNGTLREFATGAVTQHFTKTLDRVLDKDFRLPTDAELDALEAFTLSLGRQEDLNLQTLQLTNTDAERGRVLFMTEDSENRTVASAKCTICHQNAGALTVAGVNQNFETGRENMLHPAAVTGQSLPPDGGFGTQFNANTGGFGDGTFNTTSLVEVADTAPYFHHNGATTLEDAIAFYDSPEFRNSIEGQRLMLQDSGGQELSVDIDTLAAFLRVINVLDNIRAVTDFMNRAKDAAGFAGSKKLLALSQADLDDALEVLAQGELHEEDAVPHLEQAKSLTDSALKTRKASERNDLIDRAIAEAQAATALMVVDSGPDTTDPTIAILAPVPGSSVTGLVTIAADAADNVGIDAVTFTVGQTQLGQDFTAPFQQGWDTALFPEGTNQITVMAVDSSGNSQTATATVTVTHAPPPDTTNPTVSIISPATGSTVSGSITISANASDDTGVDRLIFTVASAEIGQDTTAPFDQVFDTTTLSNSTVEITATAVDTSGNSSTASVTVTVNNAPETCTVYSCPNPPPPPTEPPPPSEVPPGSSPDGEFEGEVVSVDMEASTVTVTAENGTVTLKITSSTEFMGSIAHDISQILVGHVAQGEFFTSVGEALWIEADLPPGL